jgi:tetratricopeptide (TPR) repeat protein
MDRYEVDQDELSPRKSRDLYAQAFDVAPDDYYTGINAATKSVFLSTAPDLEKANEYATRVLDIVGTKAWPGDYWKTATVAEAFLMRRDYPQAAELYQTAVAMCPKETGSHETSWTQASRLLAKLGATAEQRTLIRKAFGHVAQDQ